MSFVQFIEDEKAAALAAAKEETGGAVNENTDADNGMTPEELAEAKKTKKSFTIKIEVSNVAFQEDFNGEVDAVLQQAARFIKRGTVDKPLLDTNGTEVGSVK